MGAENSKEEDQSENKRPNVNHQEDHKPVNVQQHIKMEIDPKTGKLVGMPENWANNPVIILKYLIYKYKNFMYTLTKYIIFKIKCYKLPSIYANRLLVFFYHFISYLRIIIKI